MQLIGMLDSPYVRRVAISLHALGVPFEHRSVSVFRAFDTFAAINPVVKAPTLVCDDGTVLMDSTLILEHVASLAPGKSLVPTEAKARLRDLRCQGLALAACEKAVQIVYEGMVRPAEKRHEPWVARVRGQLVAAFALLEAELVAAPASSAAVPITQGGITAAVAWQFTQALLPGEIATDAHPVLAAHCEAAEARPEFLAAPPV